MSMKLLTGLQDFYKGLYDPSSSSSSAAIMQMEPSSSSTKEDAEEKIRRCSHQRNVHFPDAVVTHFYDAPTNIFADNCTRDISAISIAYLNACKNLRIEPVQTVQQQIACFHQVRDVRQECLSLKGHRLSSADMECLEEIFRRVQFDLLDFEYTFLDDDSAVCLGEMLEFYDSAMKLNLSFNKQINLRGWQAICKAVKEAPSLQYLNLRYTSLSDRALPVLARTLRSQPSLTILHLENVSLAGRNLILIGCALKGNTILKELYLGENNLQPADGAHIYQLIVTNISIQLLDLRNNQLQDGGLRHVCDALKHRDTVRNSALSALVLWNNRITSSGMEALTQALKENGKLETLNIGSNNLSLEGIVTLKSALQHNCSLQRLGLQATNLDCQSAIVLAECLADNKVMVRLDLRDNPHIGSAGLLALHLAMKMNTSITLLNLDTSVAHSTSSKVKEYQEQFKVYYEEIKMFCERNKQIALRKLSVQTTVEEGTVTIVEKQGGEKKQAAKAAEGKKEKAEVEGGEHDGDLEAAERNLAIAQKNAVWLLSRSSSLTCAETIEDIPERVAQMSQSLAMIEEVRDSVTTVKKQCNKNFPALFSKNELWKSPSLPLLASGDHFNAVPNPPAISRRFTVSTSSLNSKNPRDVVRANARFKVERVGSSVQKSAKAESDNCIALQRLLSESCANHSQQTLFLAAEDTISKKVENLIDEKPGKLSEAVMGSLVRSENSSRCSRNRSDDNVDEKSGLSNSEGRKDFGKPVRGSSSDIEKLCETVSLYQRKDETKSQDSDGGARFVAGIPESFVRELEVVKCAVSQSVIDEKHSVELSVLGVGNGGKDVSRNAKVVRFAAAFSTNSHSTDEEVVHEVIRDVVNYVAYEMGDDDAVHCRKVLFGTAISHNEISPAVSSFSSATRSSASLALKSSDDLETEEEVIRNVVRGLVRDVLSREKETLRRSLRKKRQCLFTVPHVHRKLSS